MGREGSIGAQVNGWRIEEYGRSLRGAELRVHLPPRPRGVLVAGMHGEEPETVLLAARRARARDGRRGRRARSCCARTRTASPTARARTRAASTSTATSRRPSWAPGRLLHVPARHRSRRARAGQPHEPLLDRRRRRSSEPETAALARLMERLGPTLVLDLHAPLELMLRRRAPPATVAGELAEAGGLPWSRGARPPAPGALRDWLRRARHAVHHLRDRARRAAGALRAAPARAGRVRHANARNVARLIATVSSMRSA